MALRDVPGHYASWLTLMKFTIAYSGKLELDCANSQAATEAARNLIPRGASINTVEAVGSFYGQLGDKVVLTRELINACRANGSFTNATLRALGMRRSNMMPGWPARLVGKEMSKDDYRKACEGKFLYNSGRLEN